MILENIRKRGAESTVRQRDLARLAGLSLGMTNAVLKKLAQRGWVAIRKINNRNIQYAVTPAGLEEIARRSYDLLKRTVRNVVHYKNILDDFLARLKSKGFRGISLVGSSEFDIILAHLCQKHALAFSVSDVPTTSEHVLTLYSEDYRREGTAEGQHRLPAGAFAYLDDILTAL